MYNNRFEILLTHKEVNKLRNLLNNEDYTDRVSKDVYAMTIGELVKSGYTLQVSHYSEKNKEQAKELLEEFEQIQDVEDNHRGGFGWISRGDGEWHRLGLYE